MIYIDNGKTVKEFSTDRKIEEAIETILNKVEDIVSSETLEGYSVKVVCKGD